MAKADGGVTIIKRKKVAGGEGHHGGAWKVAYADFVTAMMAFFLLMWLLNATTEDQRKGIADYFSPTTPIARVSGGGSNMFSGDSAFSEDTLAQNGVGASDKHPTEANQARGPAGSEDGEIERAPGESSLSEMENLFLGMSGESDVADELMSHIRTRTTDEGLIVEIFAKPGAPLFAAGGAAPTPRMDALLEMVGGVAAILTNEVAVSGFAGGPGAAGADPWELSADRAQSARRGLAAAGLGSERFARVAGKADRALARPDDPAAPRNQRVEIAILRSR